MGTKEGVIVLDKRKFSIVTGTQCDGCSEKENKARKHPVKMIRFRYSDRDFAYDFCRKCSVGIVSLHKKKVKV